jgi:hypothetical protein
MNEVRQAAFVSIGRGVGFTGLAILTIMVSLSFQPVLALRCGGFLLLLLLAVLLLKAQRAPFIDHRSTEAWMLLDKNQRPDERFAGFAIASALRDACLWFARWTAGVAAVVWSLTFLLALIAAGR